MFNNLVDLYKENSKWLSMAYTLCECKELSKDIVQEMYLKIGIKKKSKINHCYVKTVIKSVFLDYKIKRYSYMKKGERIKVTTYSVDDYVNII